tara:strand:+ start:2753 stop:2986 length:234 start_codon:yes stop_codon:yes gene_type:complete
MEELEKKVDKILFYLYKDDDTGTTGLVQDVKLLKTEVHEIQQKTLSREKFMKRMSVVFGVVGGFVVWGIKLLITKSV